MKREFARQPATWLPVVHDWYIVFVLLLSAESGIEIRSSATLALHDLRSELVCLVLLVSCSEQNTEVELAACVSAPRCVHPYRFPVFSRCEMSFWECSRIRRVDSSQSEKRVSDCLPRDPAYRNFQAALQGDPAHCSCIWLLPFLLLYYVVPN